MNRFPDTALDSALNTESDSILPSSGFTASVMTAVREEARVPAPIPFPWTRALPGFAAYAAVITILLAALISMLRLEPSPQGIPLDPQFFTVLAHYRNGAVDMLWLGVASCLTLACFMLVNRLTLR